MSFGFHFVLSLAEIVQKVRRTDLVTAYCFDNFTEYCAKPL
jgi:hypothetical protein